MMTFEDTKRLLERAGLRTIALKSERSAGCLLIAPDLSARIMAVATDGPQSENFGFVKPEAIADRGKNPQFNAYGGALRWWIGPEGGQYGVAFPPGTKDFDLNSWRISEEYNGKLFVVFYPKEGNAAKAATSAVMKAECNVENASGSRFSIGVTSRISLVENTLASSRGGHLGYLSETTFENLSDEPMQKKTGLLSIWMLGMYVADPRAFVIAPFECEGTGKIVTDTYFSPDGIAGDRLIVDEKRGYLVFRADAKKRSKIGLARSRASTAIGSMDFSRSLLTVWRFPVRRRMPYVNSLWQYQEQPYAGDVSNSYNDDGKFGNFYELECSSHALALQPKERFTFPLEIHHYRGADNDLMNLANRLFRREIQWDKLR